MKQLIVIVILAIGLSSYSQDFDRKGKLFINIGPEYRITPFTNNSVLDTDSGYFDPTVAGSYTNADTQNSGFALNYSLDYYITKNLSIGLGHSFRYALLNSQPYSPKEIGPTKTTYRLMMDYHVYADYHVKVFREGELFVRLGISLLNRNSSFQLKETHYDDNGNYLGTSYSRVDYAYESINVALGYKKKKVELMAGFYIDGESEYFTDMGLSRTYYIPYLKFNFNVCKF